MDNLKHILQAQRVTMSAAHKWVVERLEEEPNKVFDSGELFDEFQKEFPLEDYDFLGILSELYRARAINKNTHPELTCNLLPVGQV